ncbi:MAG: UDP-glucose dehydrogenase family protein [Candidatus Thorarchaeota archaeon]
MSDYTVTVIGMGHLGLPLAVTFARSDIQTYAMDIDEKKINILKNGHSPLKETDLEKTLQLPVVKKNFIPTTDIKESIMNSDASFILVNTPSQSDGSYSLRYVLQVAKDISLILKTMNKYHVVVLVSTVSPRDSLTNILPVLEENSRKKCGKDFGFVHNPEFVALGSVLNDMLHPDFRVIGEFDKQSGDTIEKIYLDVSKDPIMRMGINNAELVKIALNCYLTIKISFANTIGEICRNIEGGNAELITKTLGLDKRISPKFLNAGLGYGGPCFPRDDRALIALANSLNCQAFLSEASSKVNTRQYNLAIERITSIPDIKNITVLGVSFKPNVPYITESQAFQIAKNLAEKGKYLLTLFDPQAMDEVKRELKTNIRYARSAQEAIKPETDLIVILTPWKDFENLDFKGKKVINFWKN